MPDDPIKRLLQFAALGGRYRWLSEIIHEVRDLLPSHERERAFHLANLLRYLVIELPAGPSDVLLRVRVGNDGSKPRVVHILDGPGPSMTSIQAIRGYGYVVWHFPLPGRCVMTELAPEADGPMRLVCEGTNAESGRWSACAVIPPSDEDLYRWARLCNLFPEHGVPAPSDRPLFVRHPMDPAGNGQQATQGHPEN